MPGDRKPKMTVGEIGAAALELPLDEPEELVERLRAAHAADREIDSAWRAETRRRMELYSGSTRRRCLRNWKWTREGSVLRACAPPTFATPSLVIKLLLGMVVALVPRAAGPLSAPVCEVGGRPTVTVSESRSLPGRSRSPRALFESQARKNPSGLPLTCARLAQ